MRFFLLLISLFISISCFSQSVASFDYGGSYYSNDQGQFFSSDIVQTSKLKIDDKVLVKVGFLNNRLLSLIANGQNNGTSSAIPIIVFPNPTSNNINFFVSNNYEVKEVFIYAASGKMVIKAGTQKTINVSNLAKGLYILQIQFADNRITTAKFLKL
ncbi:MAG: T9SS type A sorting domain-containing protein [Chitinophagaceae bacterium]|nr:T9SS type A sorting domain-containing protein [Chitinophagaceae bacterium]